MKSMEERIEEMEKAVFDGSAGQGAEMLPEEVSKEIIMRVWDESWARKAFRAVTMRTLTLKIPKITGGITMQGTTGQTDPEASETAQSTAEIELSMKTIIGNAPIDSKTEAYAIPTLMPKLIEDITDTVLSTEEDVFINGDQTAGANNINGVYQATNFPDGIVTRDPRLELDGLRHFARETAAGSVNASGASLTTTHIRRAFGQLGLYGKKKEDLIVLVSLSVETTMLGWTELITLDKYGPKATILTGEIGKLFGTTVIGTSHLKDTMDSTGVARSQADGNTSGNNRTVVLVFNKKSPIIGNPAKAERKFSVKADPEPQKDRVVLVPKEDFAFANFYDEAICQIINVLPGTT